MVAAEEPQRTWVQEGPSWIWWKQLLLAEEPWEVPDGPRAGRGGLCWKFKGFFFKNC